MGGKSSTISNSEQRILSLQVQQSSQGLTLPVVYGRARVAGNLIWYGDFVAIEHKTTTRQGKGGGGVKQVDIKYTYEAAVMMALCEGEIKGVNRIWRDKEKFESLSQLRLSLAKGGEEQPVWTHLLQGKHKAQAVNYSGTAYLCSPNYELTKSAQIYQHNFEVDGKLGYSDKIPDANPRDIAVDLLTNQKYGCGFPVENLGDTDVFGTYCRASGIFLSPAYTEQQDAQQNIAELLEQTNSAAVFSEGRLKIVPYGDAPLTGNGAVYVPNLTPLYDLTDDDFIVSGAEDPVSVERKTNADAFNQVQVEYLDRANDYNIAVAEAKDQANIEQYGLRPKDAVKMHGICDKNVAQQVAQLLLQRALYVRNEYEFKLSCKFILLEPMDLVTLTDVGLGLDKTPVRIIEIEEDADGVLTVKAEDFPLGTASATQYPTQPSLGYSADYNASPGNAHVPVIFEAPLQLTDGKPEIWLATAGGDMWGGAEVWASSDGDTYSRIGVVNSKARYGSLSSALADGAVFDRVNVLDVEIGAGQLAGGTEQDSRDLLTLCYAGGEFLAYAGAELKGVGRYALNNLTRGAYGTPVSAHAAGSPFVRVDDTLFRYAVPKNWIGRTVWVKLASYNVFGSGLQDLSEVAAYSYRVVGAPLGAIRNLRLTSSWSFGSDAVLSWDIVDGAESYDVEVYAANSQRLLRSTEGIVANAYTYSVADMKADGGQVRDVVFKVRARASTGKTGAWAQIAVQNPQLQPLEGIEVESGLRQAFFRCTMPSEPDFAGIVIWVSENAAVPAVDENKIYDGAETFALIARCNGKPLVSGKTYYLRAAGYDAFGKDNMAIGSSISFTVADVSVSDLSESHLNKDLRDKIARIEANGSKIAAVERVNSEQARQIASAVAEQGKTAAALEAEKKARADGDKAEAAARQTLQTAVNGNRASIQTQAKTINGLAAQYTVKIDNNGRVSGFGLASEPVNGKPRSKFIVNADSFGIGATGKSEAFPFVVDTVKNQVGINGKFVVNGGAIFDNLNAGEIHGALIRAGTLEANALKSASITADKLAAGAVTADKMNVASLSALSSDLGKVTAGHIDIGNGAFAVGRDGKLTANDAVIRGRIEAESGYFNGTVKASHIEGDVMKVVRMRKINDTRWELTLPPDELPRMVKPDFSIFTGAHFNTGDENLAIKAELSLNNVKQPHTRVSHVKRADLATMPYSKTQYLKTVWLPETSYGWIPVPANQEARFVLELFDYERVSTVTPCMLTAYMSPHDAEYRALAGKMVWKTVVDSIRIAANAHTSAVMTRVGGFQGALSLPPQCYGVSFEYRVDTNRDWASGVYWDTPNGVYTAKAYNGNHNGDFKRYVYEGNNVASRSNIVLAASQGWQWVELRDVKVLMPEHLA